MEAFRLIAIFSLLTAIRGGTVIVGEKANGFNYRQRERTLHLVNQQPPLAVNDYGFNGFAAANQQQAALQTPWWNSDELLPNVFPWLPNQRLAENPAPVAPVPPPGSNKPSADLINFLNGPDGKDGPMKHIMRVLRILPPKDPIAGILPNGQPVPVGFLPSSPPTRPPNVDQICPLGTEPLFKQGRYSVCNPRNATGCPLGYVCDRSALLLEHICCKDRNAPPSLWTSSSEKITTPTTESTSSPSSTPISSTSMTSLSTTASPSSWFNVTEPSSSSPSSGTTKSIWAVWSEWTVSQSASTTTSSSLSTPTSGLTTEGRNETNGTNIEKQWPPLPGNPFVHFPKYPSPNQFPAAIGKRIWQPIDPQNQLETKPATRPPWEIPEPPPVVELGKTNETSTPFPVVTIELNGVEVLPLTIGNVMSLPNGDFEWASTITLIRDGDKTILVDTGVPADTNILIRELSKHGLRPENIDTVVITHGHPDHFGNQNLFSRKRQLFSSFEFIGNRFSRTALVDQQFRKLYPHVEVWKTPGHTPEDLTVIVRDVPTLGTVAIVGDLILNEDFLLNPEQWSNTGSWDRHIQQNNINMIVCMVDCIVPGHGGMFRLHDEHRKYSNCAQRYPVYYANYYG